MKKEKPFYYGGQAVMGGIMIRGRNSTALAVRKPDGTINVSSQPLATLYKGKWRDTPFIRGIITLIESVALGTGALMQSAQILTEDEDEKITPSMMWGSVILGVVLAVALFFVLPLLMVRFFDAFIASSLVSNLIEGVLRILFFIIYLVVIGRMQDIREIFAYHGAEHMSVNAYEASVPLEVQSVRQYSTAHTRCGTSFLLVVLVIAIVVFALLGRPSIWLSILWRIILIPVIAAISYELIRFEANYSHNLVVRWLLTPGLWLQALTTRKPSDSQLEVAISAMRKALETDSIAVAASTTPTV
ncbi:MAG: DUF1385 domain-containing protein [Dehalococcoidia bacterium]|nr:DUF1385 domain-containing protein [Dehalococcoidia bacterium]